MIANIQYSYFHRNSILKPSHPLAAVAASVVLSLTASLAHAGSLGVYTSGDKGFNTHTFYYDDGKEVTLIDTQFLPELTKAMVDQVKKETKSPITRVIVTHPNPDKFNGLPYLHTINVESIASKATSDTMPALNDYKKNFFINVAKMFTEETYPKFENVKSTFSGQQVIKLKSGETLTLFELKNSGVTNDQVVVRIDRTGDLVVGDLLTHGTHAWLEGAIVNGKPHADLAQWQAALGELPALSTGHPKAKVYGGRGDFVPVAQAVKDETAYLAKADAIVSTYVAGVDDKASLTNPATSQTHYAAITKQFVDAYPQYKLPGMVTFSVYGLIGTKLQ
jgi:glyoxylase-like metal-dependent hydrolase (beta-lactamase superfamily II)